MALIINYIRMLINKLIFRSLVNFHREHEVIEAIILDNYTLISKLDILLKYKNRIMLDND